MKFCSLQEIRAVGEKEAAVSWLRQRLSHLSRRRWLQRRDGILAEFWLLLAKHPLSSHTYFAMSLQQSEFMLGEWHVTPLRGVVSGPGGNRHITPKAMDVLLCLAERPGEVVNRETFLDVVWQGRAFSDDPLNKCIAELRRQLGDRAGERRYIETVPKRGYRLVAELQFIGKPPQATESRRSRQILRIAAIAVIIALAAVGAWRLSLDIVPDGEVAIAVLPFENLGDADQAYFADGVHEDLIAELSQGATFEVRSRTSTLPYRDVAISLREIAKNLDVDVVVAGSVRQSGDLVRVSAQLIGADDDENLWGGSIEKTLSVASLFAIQNEIAREIASALKITLDDDPRRGSVIHPTDNMASYDAFMLGKFHYRRKLPGDIQASVTHFERAVTLDPGFADAWDWLAYAYNHAATGVGYLEPAEAYPKARAAALRALEIEPDLATAQSILGYVRAVYDHDWVGAVADLKRALELAPYDSGTVWSLAHVYSMLGRHAEAIALTRDLAERAPEIGRRHVEVANRLIDAGQYSDALTALDLAEANGAEPADVAHLRGIAMVGLGHLDAAAPILEFAVDAKQRAAATVGQLAFVYGQLGRRSEAMALLAELQSRSTAERISQLVFATVYAGLDDMPAALQAAGAAAAARDREVLGLRSDPFMAELLPLPEIQALMDEFGLPVP